MKKNPDCEKIFKLLEGKMPSKTFFNIGLGSDPSHDEALQFKFRFPNIVVYGVEANGDFVEIRKKDYPGKIFKVGIWSEKCRKTLTVPKISVDRASLLEAKEEWAVSRKFKTDRLIEVDCVTLDDIDTLVGFPESIYLWMDIEGAELEALKGAKKLLKSGRVNYISLEVSSVGLPGEQMPRRMNEPTILEIDDYLNKFGYVRKSIFSRATIWVNVLYVAKWLA